MSRHTMGYDGGGRRPVNPPDAPKVTGAQVRALAEHHGIVIRREGQRMWYFRAPEGWITLGETNYIAHHFLRLLIEAGVGDECATDDTERGA